MKFNRLGSSKLIVSKVCLGTMTFGEQNTARESHLIMDFANEEGINFFDTAEMYPTYPKKETQGDSERIIGDWISKKKNRHKIIIATKISSNHPKGLGATGLKWIRKGGKNLKFDKKNLVQGVNDSLKRLKTDYIDLYQLHWPERNVPVFGQLDYQHNFRENKWTPLEEVLENLDNLVKAGKIRQIGLSNETPWGMLKFLNYSEKYKLIKPISIQNGYNLVNRTFDIANAEVSIREKCSLVVHSALAGGLLSGKYLFGKKPKNSRFTSRRKSFYMHNTKRTEKAIKKYLELAKKNNLSLYNMAYAFVINKPYVASCIIGATSVTQLKNNLKSININLSKEILKDIDNIHSSDPNPYIYI